MGHHAVGVCAQPPWGIHSSAHLLACAHHPGTHTWVGATQGEFITITLLGHNSGEASPLQVGGEGEGGLWIVSGRSRTSASREASVSGIEREGRAIGACDPRGSGGFIRNQTGNEKRLSFCRSAFPYKYKCFLPLPRSAPRNACFDSERLQQPPVARRCCPASPPSRPPPRPECFRPPPPRSRRQTRRISRRIYSTTKSGS